MNGGRKALAEALAFALTPSVQIVSDARVIDHVRLPGACVVWGSKHTRQSLNGFAQTQEDITLWVLSGSDVPTRLEDDLDELLVEVLGVIESQNAFTWTEAERGVLADKFDGWRISVHCINQIETT